VFAEMNGLIHWDNNGGWNYRLGGPSPARGVAVRSHTVSLINPDDPSRSHVFSGEVEGWDYPGDKSVTIVHTMDDWATVSMTEATRAEGNRWTWSVEQRWYPPPPAPGSARKYAVRYRVGDAEFWANNGGQNYTLPLAMP
jgi:hypothetical protein